MKSNASGKLRNSNSTRSYMMLIFSMLVFGTIGIFRRYIPLSSALTACLRGIIGSLFLCAYVKISGRKIFHDIEKKSLFLLIISGFLIGINWMLLFEAYNHTTVAVATLCYYMEPTIVILASPLLFKEKLSAKNLICAGISVVGMIFVSGIVGGKGIDASDLSGVLFGLSAAMLYSSVVLMNKKIHVEDFYQKTIIQLISASFVMFVYVLFTEDFSSITLTPKAIIMTLIVGIVHTGISYAFYFGSMENLRPQSIAVLSYIDPVSALILSAIFLDEYLSILGIAGAILIIGAALISELKIGKN